MDYFARRLGSYIRRHHVGLIAVFIALGGSAYAANSVKSTDISDGEVKAPDIAADAVTSAKIKPGAVQNSDLAPNAVGSDNVIDNSLKGIDVLDESLEGADVLNGSLTAVDFGLNSLTGDRLEAGTVRSREIGLLAISSTKLQPAAVTASKIKNETVGKSDIGPAAVGASEIAPAAVGAEELSRMPGARTQRNTSQGIPKNVPTQVGFNSDVYDPDAMRTSSDINNIHVPVAGRYLVAASLNFDTNDFNFHNWALTTNEQVSTTFTIGDSFTTIEALNAGDRVGMMVVCGDGDGCTTTADLAVQWLGPK